MTKCRVWQGVRMRTVAAGADPDAAPVQVTLPAAWDDAAAGALAALAGDDRPAALPGLAEQWYRPLAERARRGGLSETLLDELHALLRDRRGMADPAGLAGTGGAPRFVLNLPAFHGPDGFDVAAYVAAIRTATLALAMARPDASEIAVGMADLDGLLAALGLDHGAAESCALAAALAAVLRGEAETVSAHLGERFGATAPAASDWPAAPSATPVPGLAEAAHAALSRAAAAGPRRHRRTTGIALPGAPEALLGVEAGGIGPAFAPVGAHGLTRAATARLAAMGLSAEAALARVLAGAVLFPTVSAAAEAATRAAVSAYIPSLPAETLHAAAVPVAAQAAFEPLPARHAGSTQRASIGAHRLFLRTGEYADGRIAEIALSAPRETATARGLLDGISAAVSLGLQHGVPLNAYVEAFLLTRFGPAGTVEGDPHVSAATSPLDWMARHLAATVLGRADLPVAETEAEEPARTPLLPLDLPDTPRARRRNLRVVA